MSAFFELHIESEPILEMEKQEIVVMSGVQAHEWYTMEIKGRAGRIHTVTARAVP